MSGRLTTGLLVLVLASATWHRAAGQTLDRSRRPVVPQEHSFKFPQVRTQTLPNGLRLAVVENHALPVVAARVAMSVDSLTDPVGKEGLFALTQTLLREGTTSRSAGALADEFAELGDNVTASGFTMLSSNFSRALGLMADMIVHPSFPQAALEQRKAARIASIKAIAQSPNTAPRQILYAALFGADHPLTRSISITERAVASITREDVQREYEQYFRPGNMTLVVAGDITLEQVAGAAERAFADWKPGPVTPAPAFAPTPSAAATTIYLIDKPGSTQGYIYVGQLGPPRTSPDFHALETLAPILGAIPGSRLQNDLRERHAYAYASTPFTISWRRAPAPSTMFGQATVNGVKTDSAVIEWIRELNVIRGPQPVTAAELGFGQAARAGSMPARIETTDSIATRVSEMVRDGLPFNFFNDYVARIRGLDAGEVSRAATAALDPRHLTIVVAADRKLVEAGLRASGVGPVIVVNEDGKPVP